MEFVVYVELENLGRWFYGIYTTEGKAQGVARDLRNMSGEWYDVCTYEQAQQNKINNLPA